jgi:hypothetical protein
MNKILQKIKNLSRFIFSNMFFLFVGVGLALVVHNIQAVGVWTTQSNIIGQPVLTSTIWNQQFGETGNTQYLDDILTAFENTSTGLASATDLASRANTSHTHSFASGTSYGSNNSTPLTDCEPPGSGPNQGVNCIIQCPVNQVLTGLQTGGSGQGNNHWHVAYFCAGIL